ncbi:MAG: diguanylate cyclase [Nitrospirota bacterium]
MIQQVINTILELSLKPISLSDHLHLSLEIISTVPWLSIKETGCIFVAEHSSEILVMRAYRGVSPKLLETCGRLPFGKCLCGRVAVTGNTIFKSNLDEHHDVRFDGMKNHGHYCVPIKSTDRVLGVINLYVKEGHVRNALEDDFLSYVANTLAGIILRKEGEDKERALFNELEIHRNNLEELIQIRTSEIETARNETKLAFEHLKIIVDTISAPVLVVGMDYRILLMNKAVKEFYFGSINDSTDGLTCFDLFHRNSEKCNNDYYEDCTIEQMCKSQSPFCVVHKHYRHDGQLRILEIHATPLKNINNECEAVVMVNQDITESKMRESQLEVMASYDALTSILNRAAFVSSLTSIIYRASENNQKAAVMYMDLDYFKEINDTYGHDAGDLVLQRVAMRLTRSIRDKDVVARLGGDEFGIVLVEAADTAFVETVCKRVVEAARRPIVTDKGTFNIGISIGISIFPADGDKEDILIKRSDIAMYQSKRNGKNGYTFYSKALEDLQ